MFFFFFKCCRSLITNTQQLQSMKIKPSHCPHSNTAISLAAYVKQLWLQHAKWYLQWAALCRTTLQIKVFSASVKGALAGFRRCRTAVINLIS